MSDVFTLTVWDCLKYLYAFLYDWFDYTIHWNSRLRELAWEGVQTWARMAFSKVFEEIEAKATAVTDTIEDWAVGIIGHVEEGATTIVDRIEGALDSIVALWARFGPDLLGTTHTVVSWVDGAKYVVREWAKTRFDAAAGWAKDAWDWVSTKSADVTEWIDERADEVWDWINTKASEVWTWISTKSVAVTEWIDQRAGTVWDWIRDRSAEVWTWISTKSGEVWDWLTGTGTPMETLYDKVKVWLEDLYDTHRDRLATFLDDPKKYILDYVKEWYAGLPDEPPPDWLDFLKKLFADPIGTLWAYLDAAGQFINAWIEYELVKRTPSWASLEEDCRATDSLIPDEEEFAKGLLEPVTPEEIEDYEEIGRVIDWAMEGTLDQHPFLLPGLPAYRGGRYL